MTDELAHYVPAHDSVQHGLTEAGLIGVSVALPFLGQIAADATRAVLDQRAAKQQREFNLRVAQRINELATAVEGSTGQGPDEETLLAAYTRGLRAYSETSSEEKRSRLAAAVASFGVQNTLDNVQKERLLDLVERLDDMDVALLSYADKPGEWLSQRDSHFDPSRLTSGPALGPFYMYVSATPEGRAMVEISRTRLATEGLAEIPEGGRSMTATGILESRSTAAGRLFLDFIQAPTP